MDRGKSYPSCGISIHFLITQLLEIKRKYGDLGIFIDGTDAGDTKDLRAMNICVRERKHPRQSTCQFPLVVVLGLGSFEHEELGL